VTNDNLKLDYDTNRISIPKFIKLKAKDNRIKCKFSRKVEGTMKSATVSQDKDGRYYVSILCEVDMAIPEKKPVLRETAIGIDFGVKTFLTFDNGDKVESPMFLKQSHDKLVKHQQELVKLEEGTTKYKSKREQITRLHAKIARKRKDFLDKLTYRLCHENQVDTICIEDLSIKDMQSGNKHAMNRAIGDLAWNKFVQMLTYKANWYGKNVIKIGRFEPSSKTCHECGYVKHDLTLSDREWTCPSCGHIHDRDVNAAKNIKDFALPDMNFNKRVGTTLSNRNHIQ
jgi:putative transposase